MLIKKQISLFFIIIPLLFLLKNETIVSGPVLSTESKKEKKPITFNNDEVRAIGNMPKDITNIIKEYILSKVLIKKIEINELQGILSYSNDGIDHYITKSLIKKNLNICQDYQKNYIVGIYANDSNLTYTSCLSQNGSNKKIVFLKTPLNITLSSHIFYKPELKLILNRERFLIRPIRNNDNDDRFFFSKKILMRGDEYFISQSHDWKDKPLSSLNSEKALVFNPNNDINILEAFHVQNKGDSSNNTFPSTIAIHCDKKETKIYINNALYKKIFIPCSIKKTIHDKTTIDYFEGRTLLEKTFYLKFFADIMQTDYHSFDRLSMLECLQAQTKDFNFLSQPKTIDNSNDSEHRILKNTEVKSTFSISYPFLTG